MDESPSTLRIRLDRQWSVREMTRFLMDIEGLYDVRLLLLLAAEGIPRRFRRIEPGPWPQVWNVWPVFPVDLDQVNEFIYPTERLRIARIQLASPGDGDFTGIGEATKALGDLVKHGLDLYVNRDRRQLQNERQEADNEAARIENERRRVQLARDYVALADEVGLSVVEKRQLVAAVLSRQDSIGGLIEQAKITDVRILPPVQDEEGRS